MFLALEYTCLVTALKYRRLRGEMIYAYPYLLSMSRTLARHDTALVTAHLLFHLCTPTRT